VTARRAREGGGLFATAAGAVLLLALGFGIGLVAGSALEEPDLVAKQLTGEAADVPLPRDAASPAGAGAPRPEPHARDAREAGPGAPASAPAPALEPGPGAPAPARAKTAAAPSAGDFGEPVEEVAPHEAARASEPGSPAAGRAAGSELEGEELAAAARRPSPPHVASRGPGFAVQVGAFAEREAADALVASLRAERHPAYVATGMAGEAARFRVRVGPYATREAASGAAARLKASRRLPTWVVSEGAR
jgi:cell division septation protein DedD